MAAEQPLFAETGRFPQLEGRGHHDEGHRVHLAGAGAAALSAAAWLHERRWVQQRHPLVLMEPRVCHRQLWPLSVRDVSMSRGVSLSVKGPAGERV